MKPTDHFFLAHSIQEKIIELGGTATCSQCSIPVYFGKESFKRLKRLKQYKPICPSCFLQYSDPITLVRPTQKEIKSIRAMNYLFNEDDYRQIRTIIKNPKLRKKIFADLHPEYIKESK